MREDNNRSDEEIVDLGAATELTQGAYLPGAIEGVSTKDYWDEP